MALSGTAGHSTNCPDTDTSGKPQGHPVSVGHPVHTVGNQAWWCFVGGIATLLCLVATAARANYSATHDYWKPADYMIHHPTLQALCEAYAAYWVVSSYGRYSASCLSITPTTDNIRAYFTLTYKQKSTDPEKQWTYLVAVGTKCPYGGWMSFDRTTCLNAPACPTDPTIDPATAKCEIQCPAGQQLDPATGFCSLKDLGSCPTAGESAGLGAQLGASPLVGNPLHSGSGNKFLQETDHRAADPAPLAFDRYYNSQADATRTLGPNWRHGYDRSITPLSATVARVARADGKAYAFKLVGGIWTAYGEVRATLTRSTDAAGVTTGWTYTTAQDTVEHYDAAGRLIDLTDRAGRVQTMSYDPDGRLILVTGPLGDSLTLDYDADGRLASLTDNANRITRYRYDAAGNLSEVTHPDLTVRTYHYEDTRFPHALTGITDERRMRYATYAYDGQGRATVSYHGPQTSVPAERIDGVTLTFNTDGSTTVANSRGATSTYRFIAQHGARLVSGIDGPGCSSCGTGDSSYRYDPDTNYLLAKTVHGVTTQYGAYDAKGQYRSMIEAVGTPQERRTDYTYDPRFSGKVATQTEPSVYAGAVKTTAYTYDDFGNITRVTESGYTPDGTAVSRTTTYDYLGPLHQLSAIDGPRTDVADVTTLSHYPDDPAQGNNRGRLERLTGPMGTVLRDAIQYSATGKVLNEVRPNGLTLTYTYYPGNDRLASVTESADGVSRTTRWTYLATGEVETITHGDGTPEATTLTFGYDAARRLVRITDGLGDALAYTLDTEGNRIAEAVYDSNGAQQRALSATFDLYNRLDVTAQANEHTDYDFAADGTLERETNGRGVVTGYSYDALKRLIARTQDLGGTDPATANALVQYAYDPADRLTQVKAPNGATTEYVYDDLGNRVRETSPDTGTTTFTHDAAGNVTARVDANDQHFSYRYDAANRRVRAEASLAEDTLIYTYDTCPNGVTRLCAVQVGSEAVPAPVVVTYAYDAFGDVTAHQGMAYTYDAAGRLATLTYPSGAAVTYTYNAAGRVSRVDLVRDGTTIPLAGDITDAPLGPVRSFRYGNGKTFSRTVDGAYRTTAQSVSDVLALTEIQYDAAGNLTTRTDGLTEGYGYDALNELTSASGAFGSQSYGYDANANRMALTSAVDSTSYGYAPASNRLTSIDGAAVVQDGNGNTLAQGGQSYSYSVYNRLTASAGASYRYNGLSQRIEKVRNSRSTRYVYGLDGALLAETDAAGTVQVEYVYLDGAPLAVLYPTGAVPLAYVHTDPLGMPQALTDAAGGVVWRASYDPFGEATVNADPDGDGAQTMFNLRLPGQYFDAETGLHYNYFRDYDPRLGRYLESDPIGLEGGLNTYAYVGGNPLGRIDPRGLAITPETVSDVVSLGFSIQAFNNDPNLLNGLGLAYDGLATITPVLPAGFGIIKQCTKGGLPNKPEDLLKQGYKDVSHPAAANAGHKTYENPVTGDKVRFDQGKPGAPGYEGLDHYHRYNPNATGKNDAYLDKNGTPCARGCDASHLFPGD